MIIIFFSASKPRGTVLNHLQSPGVKLGCMIVSTILTILISNFLEINFMIKTNDKNPQCFNLLEVIFKCQLKNVKVIGTKMFVK